jgi:hypothetical protein
VGRPPIETAATEVMPEGEPSRLDEVLDALAALPARPANAGGAGNASNDNHEGAARSAAA